MKIDPVFLRLKGSINKVNTDREALGLLSDCYSSEMAKVLLKLEAIQDIEIEDAICGLRRKCCTFLMPSSSLDDEQLSMLALISHQCLLMNIAIKFLQMSLCF